MIVNYMRTRLINGNFWIDEKIISVSIPARFLFMGLWGYADKEGRFEWRILKIKISIFPIDDIDVENLLIELESVNLIKKYIINNKEYGYIINFNKYQNPHPHEVKSIIPKPPLNLINSISNDNVITSNDNVSKCHANLSNLSNLSNINTMSGKPDPIVKVKKTKKELYAPEEIEKMKAVIVSFNEILNKDYSYQTKLTQKLLKPIIKIYSLKIIKAVIRMKGNEWCNDDKMERYLTPSTIFASANFEKYYNSLPIELRGNNDAETV